jgi:aryl-phospho-beta-D-glucosidase BglC (GH1 family)
LLDSKDPGLEKKLLYKTKWLAWLWTFTAFRFLSTPQVRINMLLQNVLAVAALVSSAFSAPTEQKRASKMKWFGINESGAEFGEKNIPGLYGKDYTWYDTTTIDQFIGQGMNMFRLNFRKKPAQRNPFRAYN